MALAYLIETKIPVGDAYDEISGWLYSFDVIKHIQELVKEETGDTVELETLESIISILANSDRDYWIRWLGTIRSNNA